MATKTYVKGLAQRSQDMSRYITKFELDQAAQVGPNPDLTSTIQQAAAAVLAGCNTIKAAVTYREQP